VKARAEGAAAFLRKPCTPQELADMLRTVSESCARTSSGTGQPAAAL
jgi:hypothetical protein